MREIGSGLVRKWLMERRCRFAKWFQSECWIWDEWNIRWREGGSEGDREVGEGI